MVFWRQISGAGVPDDVEQVGGDDLDDGFDVEDVDVGPWEDQSNWNEQINNIYFDELNVSGMFTIYVFTCRNLKLR